MSAALFNSRHHSHHRLDRLMPEVLCSHFHFFDTQNGPQMYESYSQLTVRNKVIPLYAAYGPGGEGPTPKATIT